LDRFKTFNPGNISVKLNKLSDQMLASVAPYGEAVGALMIFM
jgi:hypothetical protein